MSQQTGNNAAEGIGSAIKGAFNAAHGAGEAIRGTINDGADKIGEGIANDGKSIGTDSNRQDALESSGHAPQDHQGTVEKGKEEIAQGLGALSNAGK